MKKSGIPPIASPSAPGSGGVSVEGGGAGAFAGFPAEVCPAADLLLPATPLVPVCRWVWPLTCSECPPATPGALCVWGLWLFTSGAAVVEVVSAAPGAEVDGLPSSPGALSVSDGDSPT